MRFRFRIGFGPVSLVISPAWILGLLGALGAFLALFGIAKASWVSLPRTDTFQDNAGCHTAFSTFRMVGSWCGAVSPPVASTSTITTPLDLPYWLWRFRLRHTGTNSVTMNFALYGYSASGTRYSLGTVTPPLANGAYTDYWYSATTTGVNSLSAVGLVLTYADGSADYTYYENVYLDQHWPDDLTLATTTAATTTTAMTDFEITNIFGLALALALATGAAIYWVMKKP